jgi:hypothetical protein
MSRVEAATGLDRLPWLPDEQTSRPAPRRSGNLIGTAFAAVLLVGGAAFWLGTQGVEELAPPAATPRKEATTVKLPAARPAAPTQLEVKIAPVPEVEPIVAPPTPIIETPPRVIRTPPKTIATPDEPVESAVVERPVSKAPIAVARPQPVPLRLWQPRVVAGAAGRLVEVGAFGSVPQAKLGWRYMVRAYPAMTRLPAVVRPDRNSRGRIFYRIRVGTTSQAHSEVLCQRMQRIRLSCAVVDLPWKAKVER